MSIPMKPALACALLACAGPAQQAGGVPGPSPAAPATAPAPSEPPPLLKLPRDVRPTGYRLRLEVDPRGERFAGEVEIDVVLDRARDVVWLHAQGLTVTRCEVATAGGAAVSALLEQVNEDGVARLTPASPLAPGKATIHVWWNAPFGSLAGLYRSREGSDWYATTQFEAVDARRAFPCFDEPYFKVPFDVALVVPEDQVAVSNSPESGREPAGSGKVRVSFRRTLPLPSYLVFVAVGPFDVVEAPLPPSMGRTRTLPVRGLAPRGRGAGLAPSLEIANRILLELEHYFSIPFPYDKLDHVAIPDFFYGAMENAGAISYREADLLAPSGEVSQQRRQIIAETVAHEMAHQWFGDLVTPGWWTDIWLNESFAQWMGLRATSRVEPSWRSELGITEGTAEAMEVDGLAAAGPVREPLRTISGIGAQFDLLRYQKGGAVLAMLERWLGEETFRGGIHAYLRAHAHGVGSTPDLLAEWSQVSGKDVTAVAGTFLDQPGVPLVEARLECDAKGARVRLAQSRWLPRGSTASREQTWKIPVCVRHPAAARVAEACTLLAEPTGVVPLPGRCPAWIMPNAGGAGYFLWSLPPADLQRLVAKGLPRLDAAEKISVAASAQAAWRAGALPFDGALDAMAAIARDPDPEVASQPIDFLAFAREQLVPDGAVGDVEALARRLYRPAFERVGWSPRPGEAASVTKFRGAALLALVSIGRDPATTREAAARGAALLGLDGKPPDLSAVAPDLRAGVLAAALRTAGQPAFDAMLALHSDASGAFRASLLHALGTAEGPALAPMAADLWRRRELGASDRFEVLGALAGRRDTRALALETADRHIDEMLDGAPEGSQAFFPDYLGGGCSRDDRDRLKGLLEPRLARWPGMQKALDQELEATTLCAAARDADGAEAARAFARLGR